MNTTKLYVIKTTTGAAHRAQRGYSSQEVVTVTYKTLGGAERAAAKINGGVFTIYVSYKGEFNNVAGYHDSAINAECSRIGIKTI